MDEVCILGNSGSGKSTFGKQLSEKLNIDLLFLDVLTFEYSWDHPEYQKMEESARSFMLKDKYILDGNFLDYIKERYDKSDTIIFLDINRFVCLKSVLERKRMYKDKHRDSRNDNLNERINFSYLIWVLFGFNIKSRPKILKILKQHKDKNIIVLKSRSQMKEFIDSL